MQMYYISFTCKVRLVSGDGIGAPKFSVSADSVDSC
jgi:hypothetical protein